MSVLKNKLGAKSRQNKIIGGVKMCKVILKLGAVGFSLCSMVFQVFAVDEKGVDDSKMNVLEQRKSYRTRAERDSLRKLFLKYIERTDPLRYEFHTNTGKFIGYPRIHTPEYCMYKYGGAVYGKVEKVEMLSWSESPVYHTVIYIKPYETFKDVVTDSNGFVVIKTYYWGKEKVIIVGMKPFVLGEEVIVFLEDFPWTLFGISPLAGKIAVPSGPRKEALKTGKISSTSEQGYYEYARALVVKDDSCKWKPIGGTWIANYWDMSKKYFLEDVLKTMRRVEEEYKSYKKER
jgi:hypothetical protein